MDKLTSPSSPRPASFSFSEPSCTILELPSCEVPEQWLLDDDVLVGKNENDGIGACLWEMPAADGGVLSPDSELAKLLPSLSAPAPQRQAKRRGRKPGPRPGPGAGAAAGHVESERQRREKLNRRFCDLRAAVPTVSRMDKASLLADAARYIAELRARVAQLESEARHAAVARWEGISADGGGHGDQAAAVVDGELYVREVGRDTAVVRVTSGASHAPALLMGALRSLELQVQHACVSRAHGVTTQDVVVDVPPAATALQDDEGLRMALLQRLQAGD
ncbi:transcription factor MYC2 [Sorghum bicolor]|uniref:Transcription factor n=1 Tax=Sorghum bicolor TaxID=4558 RepID=C5X606_SORBI|nr:transcription factor MYC2 [Sorghum bicolor]EER97058.1 hypothetical protein SORBI_3002G267000 [Sorghum bicolor]|eukprot:XP_002460537.1 transcription factor MYC2 [Sorghum bicolor]